MQKEKKKKKKKKRPQTSTGHKKQHKKVAQIPKKSNPLSNRTLRKTRPVLPKVTSKKERLLQRGKKKKAESEMKKAASIDKCKNKSAIKNKNRIYQKTPNKTKKQELTSKRQSNGERHMNNVFFINKHTKYTHKYMEEEK